MTIPSNEPPEQRIAKLGSDDISGTVEIGAREALLSRLKRQLAANIGRWTRDELYEDAR